MSFLSRLRHLADPFGAPAGEGPAEGDRKAALGRAGEEAAATLLRAHGMRVLARNCAAARWNLTLSAGKATLLFSWKSKRAGRAAWAAPGTRWDRASARA